MWENPLDEPYRQLFHKLKAERDAGAKKISAPGDIEAKEDDRSKRAVAAVKQLSLVPRGRSYSDLDLITGIIGHRHSCLENGVQEVEYLVKWSSRDEADAGKDTEWFLADVLWPEHKELIEHYNAGKGLLMNSPKPSPRKLKRGEGTPGQDNAEQQEVLKLRRELSICKQSKENALEELAAVTEELKHAKLKSQDSGSSNVEFRKKLERSMDERLGELRELHTKELQARDAELEEAREETKRLEKKLESSKTKLPGTPSDIESRLRSTVESLQAQVESLRAELKEKKCKFLQQQEKLNGAATSSKDDNDGLSSEIMELQEKLDRMERQKSRMESESTMIQRMNNKLKEELDSELSMSFTIRQENGKLKIELEQASREADRLKLTIARLRESDDQRKELASDLDERNLQCEDLMQRVSFLEGQLQVQQSSASAGDVEDKTPGDSVAQLQMQLGSLESENGALKGKVTQLEELHKREEDELHKTKEEKYSLEEKLSSSKRQNQRLEAEKSVLSSALDRVKEELSAELASNESLRQSCSSDQDSLRAEVRALTTTTKSLRQELEQTQKRRSSDLAEKVEELEAAQGKIEHLRNQLESNSEGISQTIERETASRLSAEQELRATTQELELEKQKLKRTSAALEEVKALLDEKENSFAALQREVITQREQIDESTRTKDRLLSDSKVAKEALASLKAEFDTEIAQSDELRRDLAELREELDTAKRSLRKAEQEAESKREVDVDSIAQLQQHLNSVESQNARLLEELNTYKEAETTYKSRNQELVAAEEELKRKLQAAQGEVDSMVGLKTEISNRLSSVESQKQSLEENERRLVDEIAALKTELDTAETGKKSLQEELSSFRTSAQNDLDTKLQALETEKAELQQQEAQSAQEINHLKERIKELENKLQTQSDAKDLEAKCQELEAALARCKDEMEFALEARSQKALTEKELALEELQQSYESKVSGIERERAGFAKLQERLSLEIAKRRQLHNKLVELQGNIRVYCRVRPMLPHEKKTGRGQEALECSSERGEISVMNGPWLREEDVRFEFDQVFANNSSQNQVFEQVEPLTASVLDGYNVCIFAYGQTGSGKTYTMDGSKDNPGVIHRSLHAIFERIKEELSGGDNLLTYELKLSMLEIYNETIRDLLDVPQCTNNNADKPKRLDIRQGEEGLYVPGLTQIEVNCIEQVEEQMIEGRKNRTVGAHNINAHSSRSHLVVTVTVVGKPRDPAGKTLRGKLNLIDLAGSERLNKTGASGTQLKEAKCINKSLSALGNVIQALGQPKKSSDKKRFVPFRDSKLTYLLQDSLNGSSKVLMFVNISPVEWNLQESICSLNFATRCSAVSLGQAKRQEESSQIAALKDTIETLRGRLAK